MLDLAHRIDQPAELLDGQVLVVRARRLGLQPLGDVGLGALVGALLDPLGERRALVDRAHALTLAQVEALEQGVDLLEVVGVDRLARAVAVELLEVAQPGLDLVEHPVRRACRLVLHELVALLGRGLLKVAGLHRLRGRLAGARLGSGVLAGLHVAHQQAIDHLAGVLARGLHHHPRPAGSLGQGVELGRHHAGAHVVVDGTVGGARQRLGAGQVAVALDHAQVGQCLDLDGRRLRRGQRAHQLVARGEAEELGHQIRVQTVLGRHAQAAQVLDDLRRQADLGQRRTVEPPSHQPLDIDHLVARSHVLQRVEVGRAGILRGAGQLLEEAVLELARVPVGAALVGVEIAVLHQQAAHLVDAAPAVAAQNVLAEPLLGDLLLRVQPPLRLELGPVDAAQLGHGHEERVERGINHIRVGLRARELGQAVVGGQLAGEELPGAIDGLAQYLAARFHLHLLAQRCGLFLQALECARARAGQPLHVAHATGAELFL